MKPLDQDPCHRWDKLGLFALAGLAVGIIAAVVIGAYWTGEVPKNAEGLMGTIVAGILLFMRDIVGAIRAGWEEITRGKVNEQLAKGGPPSDPSPASAGDAADAVADAAVDRAAEIKG